MGFKMITFAIITLVNGEVFVNDTFQADYSKRGEISSAYADCKKEERMLSPCMLMSVRDDKTIVFTNVETWYQLVVAK